ncbi:MAG: phosphorybosylanthranilate isomerase, partial [Actinobacteria bacterium]|nr:phosphorybosylanthranilate isomerase [Actinomycetota bacterium]NIS30586.1 phosphorybosylanthranilate isomerase [Actinomycetota bacterium]NIT95157.1 phosphorybosylanthranilate isomerase [Actinomycetota bacterium]NIU18831.1 phosphorybosylanthranilate isomerase [Actinomycetota bacterium]NIU65793.1 phosphorybosylanthranilate isomerase [Actinomycetota bacterium]
MVHLGPLPGSPAAAPIDATIGRAVDDARALGEAGFDALMVENFGDAPFFADAVPAVTATAMTRVVTELAAATDLPIGVNVLRNDGLTAV